MTADTYIIKALTERGKQTLAEHVKGQEITPDLGLQFSYTLLVARGVPNAQILHRFSEVMQREMLVEAIQSDADIEKADKADNEIEGVLNVLFDDPPQNIIKTFLKSHKQDLQ